MIDKDNLDVAYVQRWLSGIGAVYNGLVEGAGILKTFDIGEEGWLHFGNPGLVNEFVVADATYRRAGVVIQALVQPGILISEDLLAIRLGVDKHLSSGWVGLREALTEFKYTGAAAEFFPRWWARGLERWWEAGPGEAPLASMMVKDRHMALSESFSDLDPLGIPEGSPGERPWRYCSLTLAESGEVVPLDPSRGVRFALHKYSPDWMDPSYAALGPAMRHAEDPRVDGEDLERLSGLVREGGGQ